MQKITPFLWFDTQAEEEALQLRNSECGLRKWPRPAGTVMTIAVELQGQQFVATLKSPAPSPERYRRPLNSRAPHAS